MAQPLGSAWPDLAPRLAAAKKLLAGLDFDGTLAPIAPSPSLAELPAPVRQQLSDLRKCAGMAVAVVSGRALDDLQRKVALPGVFLVGNHGLEGEGPDWSYREPRAADFQDAVRDLDSKLRYALGYLAGVFIENKRWALAVHYRQATPVDAALVIETVERLAGDQPDFVCLEGHQVRELRPGVGATKGTAMERLAAHLGIGREQVLYVGDDATDEEAFAACAAGITIKVGVDADHTAAQYLLSGPDEVATFLQSLRELRGCG
jgi:trehalose-phosphatase